ncbi:MAG: hypothetical protein MR014_00895 [Oscillospiraceae bacterium]|nr:hypothetical protein [Oscillospiraceae bacterium]
MGRTLSYYAGAMYRDFSGFTEARLQELGLHYGSLFLFYTSASTRGAPRRS